MKKIKLQSLSSRQRKFISEYLIDRNATQAAIRSGYSKKTADVQGPRLLGNVRVKAALEEAIKKQEERTQITADRILQEIFRIAMVDIRRAYDDNGNLLALKDMPEDIARSICSFEVDDLFEWDADEREKVKTGVTRKIRLNDKIRALELLGNHLKLFTKKIEATGKDGGPIKIEEVNPHIAHLSIEALEALATLNV